MADEREELIRLRAYVIWKEEGCPQGQDLRHWLQAEQEMSSVDRLENPPEVPKGEILLLPAAAA